MTIERVEHFSVSKIFRGKLAAPGRLEKPWLLFNFFYKLTETANEELDQKKRLNEFTLKMINLRRDDKANGILPKRKALLDYMIEISEIHPDFTDDDIVNEASTFMLAVSFKTHRNL